MQVWEFVVGSLAIPLSELTIGFEVLRASRESISWPLEIQNATNNNATIMDKPMIILRSAPSGEFQTCQNFTFFAGFYWVKSYTRGRGSKQLFASYTASDTPFLSNCYTHNSLAHFTISSNLNRRLVHSKTLLYFRLFGHIKMHARLLTEVLSSGSSPQTCLLSAPHLSRSLLCVDSVCHVCLVSLW